MAEENEIPDRSSGLRQRAEEMLLKQHGDPDKISPADVQSIFHELEVHQIELEMQNDELRSAQQELEASRKKYFDLYDLAPVGYVTLNEKGLILETNLTAAALLGKERSNLVGQPLSCFIFREDQDTYYHHCKRLFETRQHQECEVRMLKGNGTQFWARLESVVESGNNGEPASRIIYVETEGIALEKRDQILIALVDIFESKKAEETLRLSDERCRAIFNSVNDAIFVHDRTTGAILDVNLRMCEQYGYTREEARLLNVGDLSSGTPPFTQRAAMEWINRASVWGAQLFEWHCKRKDGSLFWAEVNMRHMNIEGDERVIVIVRDITKRKRAEEALRKACDELDEKVHERTSELYNANAALRVLLKQREEDKNELEEKILSNVRELIMPLIEELKKSGLSSKYRSYLDLLESNLVEIISPFSIKLSSKYANLTNKEILVADFIKRGKSTKEIAGILDVSKATIDSHRNNIRKKLGLNSTKTNLRTYLSSII